VWGRASTGNRNRHSGTEKAWGNVGKGNGGYGSRRVQVKGAVKAHAHTKTVAAATGRAKAMLFVWAGGRKDRVCQERGGRRDRDGGEGLPRIDSEVRRTMDYYLSHRGDVEFRQGADKLKSEHWFTSCVNVIVEMRKAWWETNVPNLEDKSSSISTEYTLIEGPKEIHKKDVGGWTRNRLVGQDANFRRVYMWLIL
jgi:hypothetical protein